MLMKGPGPVLKDFACPPQWSCLWDWWMYAHSTALVFTFSCGNNQTKWDSSGFPRKHFYSKYTFLKLLLLLSCFFQ